jgi:ABC-type branched-subunit amino acid transport system ATPase component
MGKTTTIRMLTTLLTPMAGAISVFGVDTAARPTLVRRMIGCVPQLLSADATLTAREIGTPAHLGLDLTVLVAATVVGVTAAAALLPRLAR